ncbi:MAG: winged helix-turn-helix transcriptional regulator, partial [Candidatus Heimdallarchaeota archaeon]
MLNNLDNIDSIDHKIIQFLKKNGKISRRKIAEELKISPQTVQNRIKALQERGIILGYTIITNEKKIGKEITAFIFVALDRARQTWTLTEQHLL